MMFVAGFGWANPVPINPYNFKNVKKGYFWTSIAGVITNYIFDNRFSRALLIDGDWGCGKSFFVKNILASL